MSETLADSQPPQRVDTTDSTTSGAVEDDSFTLQVDFSGPCLYVRHTGGLAIDVYMPDARRCDDEGVPKGTEGIPSHSDGTPAVPHAGYLQFDVAHLRPPITGLPPSSLTEVPRVAVVHRLQRGTLDLDVPESTVAVKGKLCVPKFSVFAPELVPDPRLLELTPAKEFPLLLRTTLHGGELHPERDGVPWEMSPRRDLGGDRHSDKFAGVIRWRLEEIKKPNLKLKLRGFGASAGLDLTLWPVSIPGVTARTIHLKVANLCATNPLEWPEFDLRTVVVPDDDFKWLYQLFVAKSGGEVPKLPRLPAPVPLVSGDGGEDSSQDCFGGEG